MEHVVVLGAGVAGLAAAGAVASHADLVTVIDRDHLPDRPGPRAGAPQSRHAHTLLLRGLAELRAAFPDVEQQLIAAGAPRLDWTQQRFRSNFGWAPRFSSGLQGVFCSRDLLELELRRAVLDRTNVALVQNAEVVGLTGTRSRVTGVRLHRRRLPRFQAEEGGRPGEATQPGRREAELDEVVLADLVLDATGRSSRLPDWLGGLATPNQPEGTSRVRSAPAEETVSSNLGYASRVVHMPDGFAEDWRLLLVRNTRPDTRGGVLYPIEGDRWVVTLTGIGAQLPPHDESGFREFAHQLPGGFGELLDASAPQTHIASYRRTGNRWRHWERARAWPDGLLVVGDAMCCFNPVYGQGMSVALAQAAVITARLTADGLRVDGGAARLQRQLARAATGAWALATGEDFRNPGTQGRRTLATRAGHWYADRVMAASVHDPTVHRRFLEVSQLVRPTRDLVTPSILAAVAKAARGR